MPCDSPIHLVSEQIRTGILSPVDLVASCIDRIEQMDRQLHAFVLVAADDARAQAKRAKSEIDAGHWRGPLHGIPFAVKDLLDVRDLPTGAGSLHLKDNVRHETATSVERLQRAGAIFLGKLQMVEFAFGGWGTNAHLGTPQNPWDLTIHRSPGGSSSGSGVAVAAGMVPCSLASDTGGSIRSPASMNGVVGLKPTAASVSTHGVFPLSQTLDSIGPLTRSVEDAALVFAAIAGPDQRDPATWNTNPPDVLKDLKSGVENLTLGLVHEEQLTDVQPEILRALHQSAEILRRAGATIRPVTLPHAPRDYCLNAAQIIRTEAFANLGTLIAEDRGAFDPLVMDRVLAGQKGSASEYAACLIQRLSDMRLMAEAITGVDALLLPTTPITAPPLASIDPHQMPLSDLTRFVNYLGMCAIAVPNGVNADNMPISLQIVAPAFREDIVLRVGFAFEQATTWHMRKPPQAS